MVSLIKFPFLKWLSLLFILKSFTVFNTSGQHHKDGFTQIFDGKTFSGWEGDTAIWRIENGVIIGEVTATTRLKANTFLIWTAGQSNDFELKLEFRISEAGNSGINYRSELVKDIPYALKGYQADVDGKHIYTGQNYEERGRGSLSKRGESSILSFRQKPIINRLPDDSETLRSAIKIDDWNECLIVAKGNKLKHYINGILMSEVTDNDKTLRKSSGYLGLQVHVGPPMKTQYRNIRIKPLH
ncbi:MAG: DUF1080 domain-containing protein [Marivirga sp.]|nr:DUF1080 domain-containing protein [Marivirga sp.]